MIASQYDWPYGTWSSTNFRQTISKLFVCSVQKTMKFNLPKTRNKPIARINCWAFVGPGVIVIFIFIFNFTTNFSSNIIFQLFYFFFANSKSKQKKNGQQAEGQAKLELQSNFDISGINLKCQYLRQNK